MIVVPSLTGVGRAAAAVFVVALIFAAPARAQHADPPEPTLATPESGGAVLQGLDKVTARISTFPVSTNEEVRFGTLSIRVRACRKTPPTEPPESTAFLEISDVRSGQEPVLLFSGWMFASSPALSALEHPVYDVWVVDCINDSSSSAESSG